MDFECCSDITFMDSRGVTNTFKSIVTILDLCFRKIVLVTVENMHGCVRKLEACTQARMVFYKLKEGVIKALI